MDNGVVDVAALGPEGRGVSTEAMALLVQGIPAGTRRAYARDRAAWADFTERRGLAPVPVNPMLLLEYVTHLLSGTADAEFEGGRALSASTVERRLSAISTWSQEQGYGTPDLRAARLALRGHRREKPARARQAAPLTTAALRILLAEAANVPAGPESHRALRDVALIGLGFALGARRSELVQVRIEDVRVVADGLLVQVHRRKTRDLPDQVPVPWAHDTAVCPARGTLRLRTELLASGVATGPLFRQIRRGDHVQRDGLSPQAVADILQRIAGRAGLPVPDGFGGWSGHSLRRGFATEARRAGADPLRIARHGGWADGSAALASYLVDIDQWEGHPLDGVL